MPDTARTYRTEFEMQIDVVFEHPDRAEDFFVKGDWKNTFYTLDSLEEVAEFLANAFNRSPEVWNPDYKSFTRFVEGFGQFVRQNDGSFKTAYEMDDPGFIAVSFHEELEPHSTREVEDDA